MAGDATGAHERGTGHSGGNCAHRLVCPARKIACLATLVLGFAPGETGGYLSRGVAPVAVWVLLADHTGGFLFTCSSACPDGKHTL